MQFWSPETIADIVVQQVGKDIGPRKVIWPSHWRRAIADAVSQDRSVIMAADSELLHTVTFALSLLIAEVKTTEVEMTAEWLQQRAAKLLDAMRKIRGIE